MKNQFEFFVARRYLRAKRKQAVISVITAISVIGVAAGVMALIIGLAVTNGFRNTLQRNLLRASSHVSLLEKEPGYGIERWETLVEKMRKLRHVVKAEPALYGAVFFSTPVRSTGGFLKGVYLDAGTRRGEILSRLKQGSLDGLETESPTPGIILGSRLSRDTGMPLNSIITVISPQGELGPFGPIPAYYKFRVVGIFETGFYDLDSTWAYTSLKTSQRVLGLQDVVNSIEIDVDDLNRAPEVAQEVEQAAGAKYTATTWMEQNHQLMGALRMYRTVTIITIGLIQLVAALNILITLIMMVMEKYRDIAILMAMGARQEQIRRIFMLQGVLIGAVGTALGLIAGYGLSFLAGHYRWIPLSEEIYSMSFVPFEPRWADGIWVAAVALLISFLATLYPSRSAARIAPAEAVRYE